VKVGEARAAVIARDGGCVAPVLDPDAGHCGDRWGQYQGPLAGEQLEVDRIRPAATMGKAPSHEDPTHMVAVCPRHHRGMGDTGGKVWATSHRDLIRDYLRRLHPGAWPG